MHHSAYECNLTLYVLTIIREFLLIITTWVLVENQNVSRSKIWLVGLAVAIRFGQRVDGGIPNYIYPVKYTLTGGNMDVKYSCSGVRYLYDRFNITVSCWIVNDYMVFIKKLSGSVGI